jgi:chorismate-pyruvate lyase
MPMTRAKVLDELVTPQEALVELCSPFVGATGVGPECEVVGKEEIPEPFRWLLVHRNHMTKVLEAQYGRPMELEVVEHHLEGELYTRKILLRPAGTAVVVEFGIVRLNLRFVPDGARAEILERKTPLGAILIRHKVLRRVEPKWYLKFPAAAPLLTAAGMSAVGHPVYGRIGVIHCEGEPAIELLEVVTGDPRTFDERVV